MEEAKAQKGRYQSTVYKFEYASRSGNDDNGQNEAGGHDFSKSKFALDLGGGIYGALSATTAPKDMWLGNNGKYYSNSWGGNQYTGARSEAMSLAKNYKFAGRATVAATIVIGGVEVYEGYQKDGKRFGYNTNKAGASATGGVIGGWAGAEAGVYIGGSIGALFGGVGAIPGALIGGFVGGLVGSFTGGYVGESSVNYYYNKK